jgi:3-hydroxybutyryl-CoA dehydrogenase
MSHPTGARPTPASSSASPGEALHTAIDTIAVVGAGTMGHGIAQAFAQAGFTVWLQDVSQAALERARAGVERSLASFVAKGELSAEARDAALGRLQFARELDALKGTDYVVEAVIEDVGVKSAVLREVDRLVRRDVVIASNTSSISITRLGAATARPALVLGMHFMNPVPLMPLVELIRGQSTSPAAMALAADLTQRLGKTGVEAADYPGFIANRILMPMINEAIYVLMEGVGTVEAIDTVMKLGMNHPMGPLTLADFIGLDVCLAILDVLHEGLGDPKYRACPLLRRMVAAGQLGRKTSRGFYAYA